jgi:hypothetical protein
VNFVFDYLNGNDPIPNGVESGLRDVYIKDRHRFTKSSYIKLPEILHFLNNKKFSKLDKQSKGIYPIQIFWPTLIHPTILNYVFKVCLNPLAIEKINKKELKLVVFIDREQFYEKNFWDLYDFLNRTFIDFTIYTLFKPKVEDTIYQKRVRQAFTLEYILHKDNNYWFEKKVTNINLNKKLKFNVLGYSRHHNLDFRVFFINTLLSNNFHKNALITFDYSKQFVNDFTKNSKILKKQQKQIKNFNIDLYDNCHPIHDIKDVAKLTDISLVFGSYLDNTYCDWPFVCDKVFRPISVKLPFILLGQYHSLEYLKSFGYKTFHPYINESYDNIENNDKRMIEVLRELLRVLNLKDHDYNTLMNNLEPITNHNYNVFLKRVENEQNYLESLCDE